MKQMACADIDRMAEPEWSHREAAEILGVTLNTLQTWHKGGYSLASSEAPAHPGRGNRRKYNAMDLAHLYAFSVLIPHVGRAQAAVATVSCAPVVLAQLWASFGKEPGAGLEDTDCGAHLAIYPKAETAHSPFGHVVEVLRPGVIEDRNSNPSRLQDWIRKSGHDAVVVVSVYSLLRNLLARIADVRSKRS